MCLYVYFLLFYTYAVPFSNKLATSNVNFLHNGIISKFVPNKLKAGET